MRRSNRCLLALTCIFGLGLALGVHARQTAPPANAAGTGAISGIVTDGATRRPIAGVAVTLTSVTSGTRYSGRKVTDSKGRFVFRYLPGGASFALRTTKAGYSDGALARREVFSGPVSALVSVPLATGEWLPNANIAMWPLGSISGRIVDERGEPVVGVLVRVLSRVPLAGQFHAAAGPMTRTDDRGAYKISGLGRGSYIVTVPSVQASFASSTSLSTLTEGRSGLVTAIASGVDVGPSRLIVGNYPIPPPPVAGRWQAYPVLFYPQARSLTDATPVDLAAGQAHIGIDVTLRPVPAAKITGRLDGPLEAIANRLLRLLPDGSEELGAGSEQATTMAGPSGDFSFVNVPAGVYIIDARTAVVEFARGASLLTGDRAAATPGFVPSSGGGGPISSGQSGVELSFRTSTRDDAHGGRVRATVGADDVTGIVLAIRSLVTVTGSFVCDDGLPTPCTAYGTAEPATGDASLALANSGPMSAALAALRSQISGASREPVVPPGTFSIVGLHEGDYFLRAFDMSNQIAVKSVAVAGTDYTDRPVNVSSGRDISDVVITLTGKMASLSGRVRDARGVDIPEGALVIFPTDKSLWTRYGFSPPRIKSVPFFGPLGYRVTGLPKGEYFVIAGDVSLVDAWQDPRFFPAAVGNATRISVDWGTAATQDLTMREVIIK